MRLSPFFEDLKSAYEAELDDLTTDSAGHDVLAQRLRLKRQQLPELLAMIECNPEMLAVAFHGGMRFSRPEVMNELIRQDREDLPTWETVLESLHLEPWAAELARVVLQDPNGEQFLVVTAGVEFLQGGASAEAPLEAGERRRDDDFDDDESGGDGDTDLEEAGADWLAEQGFDRKDRFSGDH